MRRVLLLLIAIAFLTPARAAEFQSPAVNSPDTGLRLIKEYRLKPDPHSVPPLIRALSERGAFKEPESSGLYVGFLSGVLNSNPKTAKSLIEQALPLSFDDQWLLIRAVAYTRLPNRTALLRDLARRLPDRRALVDYYLTGKIPTLDDVKLEPTRPSTMDKVRSAFSYDTYFGPKKKPGIERELTFATHPELIDTLWGLYFATGKDAFLMRLTMLLPWSTERDDVDKLSVGSMAKFTLAANAARDAKILAALKRLKPELWKEVQPALTEVIEAADAADTGRIRKEALAAVDELRKKGPGSKRDLAGWGQLGLTGLSAGCVFAAATGQVEFGIPCVVGGALTQGALKYFASPE